jgi:uncharacterized membrane protein YjfL (UPF0719 family)
MATLDLNIIGAEILSTLIWTVYGIVLAAVTLLVVDRITPQWFDLRQMGNHPTAIAIFAAGIVVSLGVIIAGVIMSP